MSQAYELSDAARQASARARSAALGGTPVLVLSRPGMQGSSGEHARDRHTAAEVGLIDAGLTALRRRFGIDELVLLGFSSGGAVVANLLARRDDVACAVIGSAPLDLAEYYRRPDGSLPDEYTMRRRRAGRSRCRASAASARAPRSTSSATGRTGWCRPTAWTAWVAAAQRAGLHVACGAGRRPGSAGSRPRRGGIRHLTVSRGFEVAWACATGMPAGRR